MTVRPPPGRLRVIGTGPGPLAWMTPETAAILAEATDLVGYAAYVARCPPRDGQIRHESDNRVEIERARHGLELAAAGRDVAVVSGGDPGVFAMAAAVMEAIDRGEAAWRRLDVSVHPGVSAMQAAAAAVGAPLGADFCAISLSDNLKPWEVVIRRLTTAAAADFVIALYNPKSLARPRKIFEAFDALRAVRAPDTVVILARAVGRPDQRLIVTTLADADLDLVDMATCVILGNSETRVIARPDGRAPWVYSPRSVGTSEGGR
ncbi:precorrin-3B C(17)-methyltransferase [Siculibacillus lacustris]|uniref:Precorrin-3B C(17)-methyltransferase n=1 Tax=Siculibacillus lacustris TaxID=1549641 RepID=A0A4Q9VIX2_9HYPH|nr:precorrin-3B C(17)-methyltransferase [Siculibacillus lacustris]TBW35230.1 precorrin-3B C(17)-methyltransferase [Siculibacillus lacustris]